MKLVAETTGNFMLWGGVKGEVVEADQVNVVSADHFWDSKANAGQLTIHGRVNDNVTDAMLQKVIADAGEKKRDSAVEGFVKQHKFDPSKKVEEAPTVEQELIDAKNQLLAMREKDSKASADELAEQEKLVAALEEKILKAPRK